MLQGFKNMHKHIEKMVEIKQAKKSQSLTNQIEFLALNNFKFNLQLIIFEIEARELKDIKVQCVILGEETPSQIVKEIDFDSKAIDLDEVDFSEFDFDTLARTIAGIRNGLTAHQLDPDRLKKLADIYPSNLQESIATTKLLGFYELLDITLDNNDLFYELFEFMAQFSSSTELVERFVTEILNNLTKDKNDRSK